MYLGIRTYGAETMGPENGPIEVAQTILDLCGNRQEDVAMPWYTGVLATVSYLSPWLSRRIRPVLERKGAKRKAQLKATQKTS